MTSRRGLAQPREEREEVGAADAGEHGEAYP